MPIEIKELKITATVNSSKEPTTAIDLNKLKQEILADCMEQMLQVIKDKENR